MRITWVTRSFLDYRVPVYRALDELCGHQLTLIYNGEVVPERLTEKMTEILGERSVPMYGELRLVGKKSQAVSNSKSKAIRIPFQPGLIKAIRQSQPDVLISDGFFQWTYAPLWVRAFDKNVRHIMCYEGWKHTERNMQGFRIRYRKFVMRWMDAICCNGSLCAEYVRSLGYEADRISIGNMAADVSFFKEKATAIGREEVEQFRKANGISGVAYIFSGRLVELKGIRQLLEAWTDFSKDKDANLMLVGDGPLRDETEWYCGEHGLNNVRVMGRVEYDNLPLYYKAADCFVIPTLQDNWSLVVPEAMACGLPILCSCYNGCYPEMVTEENGWVFDPLSPDSFAGALEKGYLNRDELGKMGEQSRQIVAGHTPESVAKTIYLACQKDN